MTKERRRQLRAERARQMTDVEHKRAVAASESEITGEFTARISDWELDRSGERFATTAFDNAIGKLKQDGRPIPVLFGHNQDAMGAVLGHLMPYDLHVLEDGLYARGWIDTTHDVGLKMHGLLRRDVLRWSIGFTVKRRHQEDGVGVIDEVGELLELSAVPVPANSRTRTLTAKGHDRDEPPSRAELERRLIELGVIGHKPRRVRDTMAGLLETNHRSDDLKRRSLAAADLSRPVPRTTPERKSSGPIQIASFSVR